MKKLYFEGAGMFFYGAEDEKSDVGNYRIRTAFKNDQGEKYYIELTKGYRRNENHKTVSEWALNIDFLYRIDGETEAELIPVDWKKVSKVDYTKKAITAWINNNLNCSFDDIEVLDDFHFYYVFSLEGGKRKYNMIEDHKIDHDLAQKRKAAFDKADKEYRQLTGNNHRVIGLVNVDDESITIRCHASDKDLGDNPRIMTIPVK